MSSYWDAYLEFFSSVLLEKGAAATIEKYIFSPQANVEEPAEGKPPMQMLSRFLAGLLHPLIHTGYGAEFGLLGMVAEGEILDMTLNSVAHHVGYRPCADCCP